MSLNTYILIKQSLKKHYCVTLRSADSGEQLDDYGVEHTLEDAVRLANQYLEESEYGLSIDLEERKS